MNEPSLAPPSPNTKMPLSYKQNKGLPQPPSPQELELLADQVRAMLAGEMNVDSVATTKNSATDGILVVRGQLLRPSHEVFPGWLTKLNRLGYTPFLRPDPAGLTPEHVELRIAQGAASGSTGKPWVNLVLFVATLLSTLFVGATYGALEMPDSLLSPAFPDHRLALRPHPAGHPHRPRVRPLFRRPLSRGEGDLALLSSPCPSASAPWARSSP